MDYIKFVEFKTIFDIKLNTKKRKDMRVRLIIYIVVFLLGAIVGALITYSQMKSEPEDVFITHSVIVDKIESMGKLEVVKYNVQDIIEYKKMRQWLPNAKTALLINGEIIACVDLSKITEDRVVVSGDSVVLHLPAPEICHVKVDHSKSRVYDMTYGLWETTSLMDEAYKHAEKELIRQSKMIDLTQKARENTTLVLTPLLNAFGYNHIVIMFDDEKKLNR